MMKTRSEDTLLHFLQTIVDPFSISDLLEYLGEPDTQVNREDLSSWLVYNQMAYLYPSIDGAPELWMSRAGLFTEQSLSFLPSRQELALSVLLPGSRFLPFYNPVILPHELVFMFDGKELPLKIVSFPTSFVFPLYQFFGDEYVPQFLSTDNPEAEALFADIDADFPSEVPVSVVDLGSVYWSGSYRAGDRISARLIDWLDGVFELSIIPSAQYLPHRNLTWFADMETSLTQAFEILGPGISIEEQLSFAFFLGQTNLFPHPGKQEALPSLDEFIRWSSHVAFEPYGVESRLWFKDKSIPAQSSWTMNLLSNPASIVEESFVLLSLPLNLHLMDSYVLDSLFRKEKTRKELMERMIPLRNSKTAFCIPIIEKAVEGRIRQLEATYNWFADHEIGELRSRFVSLHSALARTVLELQQTGLAPDDIPEQGAVVLGQLLSHTISALENIDFISPELMADQEVLWSSIEGMEDSFFDVRTYIMELLPELRKKVFSVVKTKEKNDERF